MEGGVPMLNCLLQHTLRSLCTASSPHASSSSSSTKWVYSVFWRILPRNYPPPKWDHGGGALDRAKGNKRNWILVWEDGFCDFYECERVGRGESMKARFGADVFFKMSHEVYSYGEGLVGKVAADNNHKWVFRDSPIENDAFITAWNVSIDPQPKAWQIQFQSGIQTIAVISVREGIIQLGSFDKVSFYTTKNIVEDLNLVISIQRKFSYLLSIPGIYAIQRPYIPIQHPTFGADYEKHQLTGAKRHYGGGNLPESPPKSMNLGYNSPQNGAAAQPIWPIPPLFSSMPCSLGALLSKVPSYHQQAIDASTVPVLVNNGGIKSNTAERVEVDDGDVKVEPSCVLEAVQEEKPSSFY